MRLRAPLVATALLLTACGGDASAPSTAGATSTLAPSGSVGVLVAGVRWELPAVACEAVPAAIAAEAVVAAAEVEDLVAERVAGWPTTTQAPPGDAATFFVAVNRTGPTALALGLLSGTVAEIQAAWAEFEAGYAGPGWGPVDVIAIRLPGWQTTAAAIVAAVPAACG